MSTTGVLATQDDDDAKTDDDELHDASGGVGNVAKGPVLL